ncbi:MULTISPECIES: GGDEF domain-containing protein [unclassified Vibrio]|uniref:diguanylate cyclase n=1 Tax=Vibrio sp. HB236076 TaxID=3232307 RepID=A0AB39HIJ3_9VIBR|nr:GGDEF domain-containing protein [Vibrio sp. HB161653]MDP5253273.1 GGDEF domain-containing protein [Vibrio sp. HB161653]
MSEEFKKSAANLKKAVPLMLKHRIATTPANYALWYTYVDQSNSKLNSVIDATLEEGQWVSEAQNQAWYLEHIAHQEQAEFLQFQKSLEILLNDAANSVTDTLSDSQAFQQLVEKTFVELSQVSEQKLNFEDIMKLVNHMVNEANHIRQSTRYLNFQLKSASDEIIKLKQQLQEVQKEALFDVLSGLYNRRAFDGDIATLVASQDSFCLIFVDIDHFKKINDTFGHLFGDLVIKTVAKRLSSALREGICAYRYGGEEFALIVPSKPLRIARQFAETLRVGIDKIKAKDRKSGQYLENITASFGVAEYQPGTSVKSVIESADKRLYEAKNLGRNRVMPL